MTTPGLLDPDDHDDRDAQRRVNDLFHRALELPSSERTAFVRRACPDSGAIADEVLSLLDAHDHTDHFLAESIPSGERRLAAAVAAAERRVGHQVGQYRIDKILGQGGMGVVYQAWDSRLVRFVALKAIAPDLTRDPIRRERLRREAQAIAQVKHQGIAIVYALEEFGEDLFISTEFVEGETLREEIARGPADATHVLQTAIELAKALAAAHDNGVIHRDLKPENVIREPDGRVKILDFGLALMRNRPKGAALTEAGKMFGTPGYMPPEQIRREPLDARSDLFSLGILLYELLTGVHPFGGEDQPATIAAILEKEPPPFHGANDASPASGSLASGLEGIIRTLLRKAPAARFASAHQLQAALERVRSGARGAPVANHAEAQAEAIWWWKFHQAATCVFYAAVLMLTWWARYLKHEDVQGLRFFLAAMVAVVAAITLRTHLWFAASSMPAEFAHQHRSNQKWVRAAEVLLVAAVETTGFWVLDPHSVVGVTLVTCGVLVLLGSFVIEPATTRAAFGRE